MKLFYALLFFSLIHFSHSDDYKIQCYECKSTAKAMVAECEEPIPKMKELKMVKVKTCTMQNRGQKPQCFKAVGKTKEHGNVTIRDCGYNLKDNRCAGDINLDKFKLKGFNGCIEICDKDHCNSAEHLHLNHVNFLVQFMFIVTIAFGLPDKLSIFV